MLSNNISTAVTPLSVAISETLLLILSHYLVSLLHCTVLLSHYLVSVEVAFTHTVSVLFRNPLNYLTKAKPNE